MDTAFISKQTVITAEWLQEVNDLLYRILARDGQLPIDPGLATSLNIGVTVDSTTAMRALTRSVAPNLIQRLGYYAAGDGGLTSYLIDPTDTTSADNGGTIIVLADGSRAKAVGGTRWTNLKAWGAKGDSSTDDTARVQAFMDWVLSVGCEGFIDFGNYVITSTISMRINSQAFKLTGAGINQASFSIANSFSATPGLHLLPSTGTMVNSTWQISDFTITHAAAGAGACTAAFQIGDPSTPTVGIQGYQFSNISRVQIVSGFPVLWDIVHARMIRFENSGGWGNADGPTICLSIHEEGAFTGDLVFDTCQFVSAYNPNWYCVQLHAHSGTYSNTSGNHSVAGVKFINCDLYSGSSALYLLAENGALVGDVFVEAGTQIDQQTANAIYLHATGANSTVDDVHIADSFVAGSTGNQILLLSESGGAIVDVYIHDNFLFNSTVPAVNCNNTGGAITGVEIRDNTFLDFTSGYPLISMTAVSRFHVSGNQPAQRFAASVFAQNLVSISSTCDEFTVTGNGSFNTSGPAILDNSTTANKCITANQGYNPIAAAALTPGASPWTYTNRTGAPVLMLLSASSGITGITMTVATGTYGLTISDPVLVPNGVSITVAYSGTLTAIQQGA